MDNSALLFVDTSFFYALVNSRDEWHAAATEWQQRVVAEKRRLLTTEFVLIEVGDGLAAIHFRARAVTLIAALRNNPWVEFEPVSSALVDESLRLFATRSDKEWGITDCTSFVVMNQRGVVEALTIDDHFRQAGFLVPLLSGA
jgi:predicted nucleic acid-binding protein